MSQRSRQQWQQKTRRERLLDVLQRLELELQLHHTARRHIDVLVLFADELDQGMVATQDGVVQQLRAQLERLRLRVAARGLPANDVSVS